jgi:sigma-B regulation protein RsbU (phosphoserine phosphatase)
MKKRKYRKVSSEYLKKVETTVRDLKILAEISALISSTLDYDELISIVMEKAKTVMEAEACSILIYNPETKKLEFEVALSGEDTTSDLLKKKVTLGMGQGIGGWVAKNKKLLFVRDARKDKRFYQEADKLTGFVTEKMIAAPLMGRRGLIGVAEIINPTREDYDMEILQILMRHFAIAIENSIYHRESIERERMKQELEFAAVLQQSFLPETPFYQKKNLTVRALNIPAKQIGGDFYDYTEPVSGKAGIFIGDISGKGVSAALYMAKMISEFRYSARRIRTPEKVMKRLNFLLMNAPRGIFLTAIYLIVDIKDGTLLITNAGHPPVLLLTSKGIRILSEPADPPLGMIDNEYSVHSLTMQKGERILLVTDGVFEAKNKKGERIGFQHFSEFVSKHIKGENLIDTITEYVTTFSKGVPQADDLTIVELEYS